MVLWADSAPFFLRGKHFGCGGSKRKRGNEHRIKQVSPNPGGGKAFLAAVDMPITGARGETIAGMIQSKSDTSECKWQPDGRLCRGDDDRDDLIAEWVEPKRIKIWLNIYRKDGDGDHPTSYWSSYVRASAEKSAGARLREIIACIEIDYFEGDGL